MKKLVLLMMLLLLPVVNAITSDDITIPRIRIGDYGFVTRPEMDSYISVSNNCRTKSLRDAVVSIRILDTYVYDSKIIDVKKKESVGTHFLTPIDEVEPGEYLVRITVYKDGIRRVKHRYITIE